ncbi:MAG: hypothetical protein WCZ20_09095 [Hydrogenophaga sp.]
MRMLIIIAVLLAGMWMGANLARDKPLLSNPFAEKTITEKARDAADGILKNLK